MWLLEPVEAKEGQIDSFNLLTRVPTTMARQRSTFGGGTFLHWFRCPPTPTVGFPVVPARSVDSNYPFARHHKRLKRIGPVRSGRVLRHVLQTFREEDPLGFHDPARSLFNSFHL